MNTHFSPPKKLQDRIQFIRKIKVTFSPKKNWGNLIFTLFILSLVKEGKRGKKVKRNRKIIENWEDYLVVYMVWEKLKVGENM